MKEMTEKVLTNALASFVQELDWDGDYPSPLQCTVNLNTNQVWVVFDDEHRTTFCINVHNLTLPHDVVKQKEERDPFKILVCPMGCSSWDECDESCK